MRDENGRLEAIDFLKGVAILMIILVHSPQRLEGINGTVSGLTRFFEAGCQLFFLISGFSLSMSWHRKKQGRWEFFGARFFGIAPAYYFMIVFWFVFNGILDRLHCYIGFIQNASLRPVLYNIFFWHGFLVEGHNNVIPGGWYIGVAMFFYILFPFIEEGMEWMEGRLDKYLILIPFAVFFLNHFLSGLISDALLTQLKLKNGIYYQDILFNIPCFLLGIVLYYQFRKGKLFLSETGVWICRSFALIFGVIAIYDYYVGGIFNRQFSSGLFFYIIFILTLNEEKFTKVRGVYKWITKMGRESYYIYLVHVLFVWYGMPGIFLYLDLMPGNKTIKFICVLGLMLPFIYFAGKLFSNIDHKLKDYLKKLYIRKID